MQLGGGEVDALGLVQANEPHFNMRSSVRAVAARMSNLIAMRPDTPYTLEGALQPTMQARVITDIEYPHRICYVNKPWEELCGFSCDEVVGQTLSMIQVRGLLTRRWRVPWVLHT